MKMISVHGPWISMAFFLSIFSFFQNRMYSMGIHPIEEIDIIYNLNAIYIDFIDSIFLQYFLSLVGNNLE